MSASSQSPPPAAGPNPATQDPATPNQATPDQASGRFRSVPAAAWMRRSDLLLRVLMRLYLGLLIMVLPWTHIWNDNMLLNWSGALAAVALNGVTRGLVSGLGILDIYIAVFDALSFRE